MKTNHAEKRQKRLYMPLLHALSAVLLTALSPALSIAGAPGPIGGLGSAVPGGSISTTPPPAVGTQSPDRTITSLVVVAPYGDGIPEMPLIFKVTGSEGKCGARIEYGDGTGDSQLFIDLSSPVVFQHSYKTPGTYKVEIKGLTTSFGPCLGKASVTAKVSAPTITVPHAIGTYAAPTKLKATVARDNTLIPGVEVSFSVAGKSVGKAKTGPDGVAQVEYWVVDGLKSGSEIKAQGAGATGKNDLGLIKRGTKLTLGVYYTGTEAFVTEGKEVTIKGHLRYLGDDVGPSGRKIQVLVDGKEFKTDTTGSKGEYEIKYKAPMIYKSGESHTVKTLFDGDKDCCFANGASEEHTIHVKRKPNKLPPPVTVAPSIDITGLY